MRQTRNESNNMVERVFVEMSSILFLRHFTLVLAAHMEPFIFAKKRRLAFNWLRNMLR